MRKVIVVGGSAGGIEALCQLLEGLPADFPAPILSVIHVGEGENLLPTVLQRCSKLRVSSPSEPQALRPGQVYIAPPNRHLVVRDSCVMATHGPCENRHRPAVDTLFRSAARAHRSHVVGVVLSGALDDGVAGCLAIQARGGTVVVQDPTEARTPDMPQNVRQNLEVDHSLPVREISELLVRLAGEGEEIPDHHPSPSECAASEHEETIGITEPLAYTCPECGGSLLRVRNGETEQYRCNVGHTYTLESFSAAHSHALERAIWIALQRLNEQRSIQEHLARRSSDPNLQRRFRENAAAAAGDMRLLKEILERL